MRFFRFTLARHAGNATLPIVVACCIAGCGGGPEIIHSPVDSPPVDTGSLEIGVRNAPGEVQFFVDGDRIRGLKPLGSDARLVVDLPAGRHTVRARVRVGRGLWSDVITAEPVTVKLRSRTRLEADLRGTPTDPPEERMYYFKILAPQPGPATAARDSDHPSTLDVPVAAHTETLAPGTHSPLGETHVPLVVPPPGASQDVPSPSHAASQDLPTIRIQGTEVLSNGREPQVAQPQEAQPADAQPPDAQTAGLAPAESQPAAPQSVGSAVPASPAVTTNPPLAPPLLLGVRVESEPPGAQASLDGKLVGPTPLSLQLDPRLDHVVQVEAEGCEPKVQLLATEAWKEGRAPVIRIQLDCR